MVTESSSLRGRIETPVQLLQRLERHDWLHSRSDDHREWRAGKQDWEQIQQGAIDVSNGEIIMKHYLLARSYAYYGHG